MKALIIGDIHGCLHEFKELIKNIDRSTTRIICVGDLIDRGTSSIDVLDFIQTNNIECVLGNHELMALEVYEHAAEYLTTPKDGKPYPLQDSDWYMNGGDRILNEYLAITDTNERMTRFHRDITYMQNLPLYIKTGILDDNNLELLVSHTYCLNKDLDYALTSGKSIFVWDRHQPYGKRNNSLYYNVYGHTPMHNINKKQYARTQGNITPEPAFFDGCCNLDTGCVYDTRGGGWLSGLFFPSLRVIQVKRK